MNGKINVMAVQYQSARALDLQALLGPIRKSINAKALPELLTPAVRPILPNASVHSVQGGHSHSSIFVIQEIALGRRETAPAAKDAFSFADGNTPCTDNHHEWRSW